MLKVWQILRSIFARSVFRRKNLPARVPIVAMVVSEHDRHILATISTQEPLDVHFVESCDEARSICNDLRAPVILFDRDWPGIEWKEAVRGLAASPHHACVILVSAVADDYLRQELIRGSGYDVLPKPLRFDAVARSMNLALSYWASAPRNGSPRTVASARRW